jgi:hypothetical protein
MTETNAKLTVLSPDESVSQVLQQLCDQTFRTRDEKSFVSFNAGRGDKIVPIQSRQVCRLLALKLQEATGKQPSLAALRSAIDSLEDHAQGAQVAEVYVRVASAGGRVYIDLADDGGRLVEIRPDGWEVIDTAPCTFCAWRTCCRFRYRKGAAPSMSFAP